MKYYILSFLALIFSGSIYGQITIADTPHCHNLVLHAEVTGGIIPTSSGITADDNWSSVIPIGFTFNFYGIPNTQCIIGSNGCLGFDLANALAYNTWPIGNTLLASTGAAPDVVNCICGPWCDVYIPAGGTIDYSMQGVAPFRNFAVTWCGTAMFSCTTQWLTTQIILYESTGIAEVHIGHHTFCTSWNGGYAICGVKDPTGTIATTAPGRDYPANWAVTDEAWRYTPSGTTYTVSSIPYAPIPYAASGVYWYDSTTHAYLGSGSSYTFAPTAPGTYAAAVLGCDDTVWAYVYVTPSDIAIINSCFEAFSNTPCVGDSLKLWATGDSVGDSYIWSGPGSFSSTLLNPFILPATPASAGTYYCYRTRVTSMGTSYDTSTVVVTVNPNPVIDMVDTLTLGLTTTTPGETFSWTGPAGFTSTSASPAVNGFGAPNVGNYNIIATNTFGCTAAGTIFAGTVPPPAAPPFIGNTAYCYGAPPAPYSASGGDVLYYAAIGGAAFTSPPTINTLVPGTYTVYATQQIGSCVSPMDSIKFVIYPKLLPDFTFVINRGCSEDTVTVNNTSGNGDHFAWSFGDGTAAIYDSTSTPISHTHIYATQVADSVILTAYNGGGLNCPQQYSLLVDTRHTVTASFWPTPDTFCLVGPGTQFINNSFTTFQGSAPASFGGIASMTWDFGDGSSPSTVDSPLYQYAAANTYTVTLTVTDSIGCTNTAKEQLYVMQLSVSSFKDTTLCLGLPLPMANIPSEYPVLGIQWQPSWGQSLPNLDNPNAEVPNLSGFGTFVDTLTLTLPGVSGTPMGCPIYDTITVNSVQGRPITDLTASATVSYGSSIQLNASNEVVYYWKPDDGTLNNPNINNPIATPTVTTVYTVYGLDIYGCLNSASVTVAVDTSETGGLPTGFTPNNDGLNDVFRLPVSSDKFANLVEFRIFSRWGEMVFNTNNRSVGWDGTYHGVPQDMGTYYYEIIVGTPGGQDVTYKGTVTLIR